MKKEDLNNEIINILDQDIEIIFQPNDVLTNDMDMITGGSGAPGQPGTPGVPGDCETVNIGCICKKLCIGNICISDK